MSHTIQTKKNNEIEKNIKIGKINFLLILFFYLFFSITKSENSNHYKSKKNLLKLKF